MNVKNLVPIVVAVLLGAVAVFLVGRYMKRPEEIEQEKSYYLVARQNMEEGDVLSEENISARKVADSVVPNIAIPVPTPRAAVKVYGQKVMREIEMGDYILYNDLGAQRISPLAETVSAGKWAVTIGVDNISGLAGLVRPGDHVALLVTLAVMQSEKTSLTSDGKGRVSRVPATFVLYPSVKVIAVGKKVAGTMSAAMRDGTRGGGEITFEVSPHQAQEITQVRQFGRISLAMRRTGDDSNMELAAYPPVSERGIQKKLLQIGEE